MKYKLIAASILLALTSPAFAEDNDRRGEFILGHLDQDGDGLVSLTEFKAPEERMFKEADANGDGAVTMDEMRAHRAAMMAKHQQEAAEKMAKYQAKMDEAFQNMDSDGDGGVTVDEARNAAFNRMDENKDGFLSADEFKPPRGMERDGMHDDRKGGMRREHMRDAMPHDDTE